MREKVVGFFRLCSDGAGKLGPGGGASLGNTVLFDGVERRLEGE